MTKYLNRKNSEWDIEYSAECPEDEELGIKTEPFKIYEPKESPPILGKTSNKVKELQYNFHKRRERFKEVISSI